MSRELSGHYDNWGEEDEQLAERQQEELREQETRDETFSEEQFKQQTHDELFKEMVETLERAQVREHKFVCAFMQELKRKAPCSHWCDIFKALLTKIEAAKKGHSTS